jgi:hypothetical protein
MPQLIENTRPKPFLIATLPGLSQSGFFDFVNAEVRGAAMVTFAATRFIRQAAGRAVRGDNGPEAGVRLAEE